MLQYKVVDGPTLDILIKLNNSDLFKNYRLVGGTALALIQGHRKSIDLDFFTISDFDSNVLIDYLAPKYNLTVRHQTAQTLIGLIDGVKVDFIRFRYPFIRPMISLEGIRMLSVEDIAPMKLDAIVGRGKKKDFYDLYFLLQQYSLKDLLALYTEKYKHQSDFHVIRSLAYFEDAESDPDPLVFDTNLSWDSVKNAITKAIECF